MHAVPPTLSLVHRAPLVVHGEGFAPRELVRLTASGRVVRIRVRSDGGFVATIGSADRCAAGRIAARGAKGDHAVLRLPPLLCAPAATP